MGEAETRRWRLRWGPILAGAALAASIGWVGDLAGGFLAMFEPGRAGGFTWLGGAVTLAVLLAATYVGGLVAGRLAGPLDREESILHGLLVWALVTLGAAAEFTLLGAGPVVVSASTGQIRLVLGGGAVGLAVAAVTATAGALAARPEARLPGFRRRARPAEAGPAASLPETRPTGPYPPERVGVAPESRPPTEPLPPGIH